VSRGLTSHSTLYRSFWGRFLQARWPNQQRQSTEGGQLAAEVDINPTRTTQLCYNIDSRQPPLGYAQHKGPCATKTQSAGPVSCQQHRAARVLNCTIVTREPCCVNVPSLLQTNITIGMKLRRLRGAWFSCLL